MQALKGEVIEFGIDIPLRTSELDAR